MPSPLIRPHLSKILNPFGGVLSSSRATDGTAFTDAYSMLKLWNRAPPREMRRYPEDQKPFSISRDENEGERFEKYRTGLVLKSKCANVVLSRKTSTGLDLTDSVLDYFKWLPTKFIVLGAEQGLPSVADIVAGNKRIFRMVLDGFLRGNFDNLRSLTLGSSTLNFHRNFASKLTQKQRSSMEVTDDDFVGDGFIYNWNGFNMEIGDLSRYIHSAAMVPCDAAGDVLNHPHYMYSVILIAIRQKDELFKMVRSLEYNPSNERMLVRMPPGYGFIAPRYVIMRIDICHEVLKPVPLRLSEDCLLYDFHVHSFS